MDVVMCMEVPSDGGAPRCGCEDDEARRGVAWRGKDEVDALVSVDRWRVGMNVMLTGEVKGSWCGGGFVDAVAMLSGWGMVMHCL